MTNLQKFIQKAREIEGKATPGPWVKSTYPCDLEGPYNRIIEGSVFDVWAEKEHRIDVNDDEFNLELVAWSRNNLPRILDALERQAAALGYYSDENRYRYTGDRGYSSSVPEDRGLLARECQREVEQILGDGE